MQEGETSVTQSTEQNQRLRTSLLFLFSMFDMTEFITCRGDDSSTSQQIFWCDMKDSFSLWLKAVNVSTFLSSFPGNKTMEGVVTSVNTGDQTVCQQTFQSHRKKSVRTEMFELWCINQLRGAERFPVSCRPVAQKTNEQANVAADTAVAGANEVAQVAVEGVESAAVASGLVKAVSDVTPEWVMSFMRCVIHNYIFICFICLNCGDCCCSLLFLMICLFILFHHQSVILS